MAQRAALRIDWILFFTVLLLCGLGVLNLYSIPTSYATGKHLTQLYWIGVGLAVVALLTGIDYRVWHRMAIPAYGLTLVLLVAVLIFGPLVNGARRWLPIGGFSFQPSELSKIALVLIVARFFDTHAQPRGGYALRHLWQPLLFTVVPAALILKEPDLGTALLLLFIAFTMILFARLRWGSLAIVVLVGAVALPVGWHFLSEYQKARVEALFNPQVDKKKKGWQSNQAMIAISSGKLTGKGFRKGTQTQGHFVPEQHTDFVFSGWAEEWGFLGCFFLLVLYLFFILWAVSISRHARDRFGAFLALGLAAVFFWHVVVNVGMVTRLLPVVGITLPFGSYGGTSLLTMMIAVGLLMSVSARRYLD